MESIVKELIYYCRNEDRRPVVTVVLLVDSVGNVARGYAICSDMETPVTNPNAMMRNGPGLARKRAMKAYRMMRNEFPIKRAESLSLLSKAVGGSALFAISNHCKGNFIRYGDGQRYLTPFERKLLKSNRLK